MSKPIESLDIRQTRAVLKLKALPPGERAKVLTVVKRLHEIKVSRRNSRPETGVPVAPRPTDPAL